MSDIRTRDRIDKINLLCGAVYGFAPDEIRYFISRDINVMNKDMARMQKLGKKLGYYVGYILAPETQAAIERKLNQNKDRTR